MAKEKEVKQVAEDEVAVAPKSDRDLRWEVFLAAHAKQNPVKHAQRLAAGELSKIPDSFK
jgi:hypothetical protein